MGSLLERYDAGRRREVWNELHEVGPVGLLAADVRRDIEDVARRTTARAAANIETLHRRLVALEFQFEDPEEAFVPATVRHAADAEALAFKMGAVPVLLRSLLRVVGAASFRGWLPSRGSADDWNAQLLDPFEFLPDVQGEIERVEDEQTPVDERDFHLCIAGDYLHKNDVSGGGPTTIPLPSDEADACVIEDDGVCYKADVAYDLELRDGDPGAVPPARRDGPIWLVDYLRMYFEAGGFRRVAGTESYPEDLTRELADGLLEI